MFHETLEARQLLSAVVRTTVQAIEIPYQEAMFASNFDDNGIDQPGVNAGMSAALMGAYANPGGNPGWIEDIDDVVAIHGNTSADTATIYYYNPLTGQISLSPQSKIRVQLSNANGTQTRYYWASDADKIEFYGNASNDSFFNFTNKPTIAEGGSGNDYLAGGGGNDDLRGREGNDTAHGGNGNDSIYGGDHADSISGGAGTDMLGGNDGNDVVNGDDGNDTVSGGIDHDTVNGGNGNDMVSGDNGHDQGSGGNDNDSVYGGNGNDTFGGGSGNDLVDDQLFGNESGADSLNGDGGTDTVRGRSGADMLFGSSGNDELYGGADVDHLSGGSDIDYSVLGDQGELYDSIELRDGGTSMAMYDVEDGILYIVGDDGNDVIAVHDFGTIIRAVVNSEIVYEADAAILNGMDINGLGGHDEISNNTSLRSTIRGGGGDDMLRGGSNDDVMYGESGRDRVFGQDGDDMLDGGSNNDAVFGGWGVNLATGGSGMDRFLSIGFDGITDQTASDAHIFFANGDREWEYGSIENMDTAFEALVDRVNDVWLLKTHTGHDITFERDIDHPEFDAQNTGPSDNKVIKFFDEAFESEQWTWECVFHEIAHNWDDPSENSFVDDFREVAGWHDEYEDGEPNWQDNNPWDLDAPWWVPVGDGWWRDFHAEAPVRSYGATHPYEDFATAFDALMMDFIGEPYIGGDGISATPQRAEVLNNWLDSH